MMQKRKRSQICNDAGFTLLEIIAVLVIMSILAVVAVPKYFDLQADARKKAMETAMAEAVGRVNSFFAKQILSGVVPREITYSHEDDSLGSDLGDFTLSVVDGGPQSEDATTPPNCNVDGTTPIGCITLTVSAKAETTALARAEDEIRTIPRPGV